MKKNPVADWDKFMLRMPQGMRDRLKIIAAENNNSLNAEIIQRLEQSFEPRPDNPEFERMFAEMSENLAVMTKRTELLTRAISLIDKMSDDRIKSEKRAAIEAMDSSKSDDE